MPEAEMTLSGLSDAERLSLEKEIDSGCIRFREIPVPNATFGEPTTIIALIYLTASVLFAISLWLARKVRFQETSYELSLKDANGVEKKLVIRSKESETETQKEIISELGSALGLDVTAVLAKIKL
jgi:cytoskeletal protein RodZ